MFPLFSTFLLYVSLLTLTPALSMEVNINAVVVSNSELPKPESQRQVLSCSSLDTCPNTGLTADHLWQGGTTLVLTCVTLCVLPTTPGCCELSQNRTNWADFLRNLTVHGTRGLESDESEGFQRYKGHIFQTESMEFISNATHQIEVRFPLTDAPGFVLTKKEILKGSFYDSLFKLKAGTAPQLKNLIEVNVNGKPRTIRYIGEIFKAHPTFTEKDIRLSGFHMRLVLLYDVWVELSLGQISYLNGKPFDRMESVINASKRYELTITYAPDKSYDISERTNTGAINRIQNYIFPWMATLRSVISSGTSNQINSQGNFSIWAMPDLKCNLSVANNLSNTVKVVRESTNVTEDLVRNGSLVISVVLSGSRFTYSNGPVPNSIREKLLSWWYCQTQFTQKSGTFHISQALQNSTVRSVGNVLTFSLAPDPLYDLNTIGKDPEVCEFEIKDPFSVVDTTERCQASDRMSFSITVVPGIISMHIVKKYPNLTITEADIRAGGSMEITITLVGDKFKPVDVLYKEIIWQSQDKYFAASKAEIFQGGEKFVLNKESTILQIKLSPSKSYEIPKKEVVTLDFTKECFMSDRLPVLQDDKPLRTNFTFEVEPVASILTYNLMKNLTKRNFTTTGVEKILVTLSGDHWVQQNQKANLLSSISITESPSVPDGFNAAWQAYNVSQPQQTVYIDPKNPNILVINLTSTKYFVYNRAQTVTLRFSEGMISSGIPPSNTNNFTLNISQISGTVEMYSGRQEIFDENEVRRGRANVTLVMKDDTFLPKEILNTLSMCEDISLCPIPLAYLEVPRAPPDSPQNTTLIFTLGTADYDVSVNTIVKILITAQMTYSGLTPINLAELQVTVVPGNVSLKFERGNNDITEDDIRKGTAPLFYLDLKFDTWIRDTAKILHVLTTSNAITSEAFNDSSSRSFSFQSNVATALSRVILEGNRLYLHLQAAPRYEINRDERVNITIPAAIVTSQRSPIDGVFFYINVTQGRYYLSGSLTAARVATSREINDPKSGTVEIIITLEGERWVSPRGELYARLTEGINGDQPFGFTRFKSKLLPEDAMFVNADQNMVTFVLSQSADYKITADELVNLTITSNAVRSGRAPRPTPMSNFFWIRAVGGITEISPKEINATNVQQGFSIQITIRDSPQPSPFLEGNNLRPTSSYCSALVSSASVAEEPNGFLHFKHQLCPMHNFIQSSTKRYIIVSQGGASLSIFFDPAPNYDISRREVISITINNTWLSGSPPLEPDPLTVSFTILPRLQQLTAILLTDYQKWEQDSQAWSFNLTSALGIGSERVVIQGAVKFTKFEAFRSTHLNNYTQVTFTFMEVNTDIQRSPRELYNALNTMNEQYRRSNLRLVALFSTADIAKKEPDWILYTPEAPAPKLAPSMPPESDYIWLIAGVFVVIFLGLYIYYKCRLSGQSMGGDYRVRNISDHDQAINFTMKEIDQSDEEMRFVKGNNVHGEQVPQEIGNSFHRGPNLRVPPSSEHTLPVVYSGQNIHRKPLGPQITKPLPKERCRSDEQNAYLKSLMDEFEISAGSVYPPDQAGPKFRASIKYDLL